MSTKCFKTTKIVLNNQKKGEKIWNGESGKVNADSMRNMADMLGEEHQLFFYVKKTGEIAIFNW